MTMTGIETSQGDLPNAESLILEHDYGYDTSEELEHTFEELVDDSKAFGHLVMDLVPNGDNSGYDTVLRCREYALWTTMKISPAMKKDVTVLSWAEREIERVVQHRKRVAQLHIHGITRSDQVAYVERILNAEGEPLGRTFLEASDFTDDFWERVEAVEWIRSQSLEQYEARLAQFKADTVGKYDGSSTGIKKPQRAMKRPAGSKKMDKAELSEKALLSTKKLFVRQFDRAENALEQSLRDTILYKWDYDSESDCEENDLFKARHGGLARRPIAGTTKSRRERRTKKKGMSLEELKTYIAKALGERTTAGSGRLEGRQQLKRKMDDPPAHLYWDQAELYRTTQRLNEAGEEFPQRVALERLLGGRAAKKARRYKDTICKDVSTDPIAVDLGDEEFEKLGDAAVRDDREDWGQYEDPGADLTEGDTEPPTTSPRRSPRNSPSPKLPSSGPKACELIRNEQGFAVDLGDDVYAAKFPLAVDDWNEDRVEFEE